MIEIIVAIILQLTTILNGGDAGKGKAEQSTKDEVKKTEQGSTPAPADGGQGGWSG